MDLNEILVFTQVVQSGSFTQAAKRLEMPNSTVSSKIASLERRLGVTLIQRTTRKLTVTSAGLDYFRHCLEGLERLKTAESEIAAVQGEPQGLLRITAPVELGNGTILAELISRFSARYPKVTIEALLTDRFVDLLGEGVDVAIRAGTLADSSLIAKKIGMSFFAAFASPKYLKTRGTPTHPRELRAPAHECMRFTPLDESIWIFQGPRGATVKVPVSGRVQTNDLGLVKSLTLLGEGLSLLPTTNCLQEVRSGKLIRVLPQWRTPSEPMHFVYPAQRFVSPKLKAFMDASLEPLRRSLTAEGEAE